MSHYEREERDIPQAKPVNMVGTSVPNKYTRVIKGVNADVYDVLLAFGVTCPAMQHALKKMLCTGLRGHKSFHKDADEAIESIERSKELNP